jgi:hypothetical protein
MFLNQRTTPDFSQPEVRPLSPRPTQAMEARLRRALVCQQMVFLIRLGLNQFEVPARH